MGSLLVLRKNLQPQETVGWSNMNSYEQGKKVRRVSAVIYLLIMAIVVGGTYISQREKKPAEKESQVRVVPDEERVVFSVNEVIQE